MHTIKKNKFSFSKMEFAAWILLFILCSIDLHAQNGQPYTGTTYDSVRTTDLKPMITGLVLRSQHGNNVRNNFDSPQDGIDASVLQVEWRLIQPTQTGALNYAFIDNAATEVKAWNLAHPDSHFAIILRVFAGVYAPEWAKTLNNFVKIPAKFRIDPANPNAPPLALEYLGPFWRDDYINAWNDLQEQLALRYDTVPEIRYVSVATQMIHHTETMRRMQDTNPNILLGMSDRGWTVTRDSVCLREQLISAAKYWKHTRLDMTFNRYLKLSGISNNTLQGDYDDPYAGDYIAFATKLLGPRLVMGNHSLNLSRVNTLAYTLPNAIDYYLYNQKMATNGVPFYFQTDVINSAINGDQVGPYLPMLMEYGAKLGAQYIELPPNWDVPNINFTWTADSFATQRRLLKANLNR
jgi:hypothetical protein